jgi:hypothetical protein
MISALHYKRNRPYRHSLVLVLLVSWISLTLSATCSMPLFSSVMPDNMPGCAETASGEVSQLKAHANQTMPDCSLKPCLSAQSPSFPDFNRLPSPDFPVFIVCLIAVFWSLFFSYPPSQPLRIADPPLGRAIPLIYRFCKLLN